MAQILFLPVLNVDEHSYLTWRLGCMWESDNKSAQNRFLGTTCTDLSKAPEPQSCWQKMGEKTLINQQMTWGRNIIDQKELTEENLS